jgi:cellulose synthase/poly-beta-1,6-N-acetylglucosamine synthase-like glycosyltransferase
MVSIIITSYKEPNTIAKAIRCIADTKYSGLSDDFEIIQISPDKETLKNGCREAIELRLAEKYIQIVDPHKGKPHALNLGFEKAKGEIIILTDGDLYFDKDSVSELIRPFNDPEIGGVTGAPLPQNPRNTYWGYLAHCFTSAADNKRKRTFSNKVDCYYKGNANSAFPMSGYIFAIRNLNIRLPKDLAIDDLFITYTVFNSGFKLAYTPKATAKVKFPDSFSDYIKQRRRNLAGHIDIKKHKELTNYKNERSLIAELKYTLYPIKYARSPKELIWSLSMYPLRAITWFEVIKLRIKGNSIMRKTGWDRIDSTK